MATKERMHPASMTPEEQELARVAQRCIIESLDRSKAVEIILSNETGDTPSTVSLPPKALRLFAQVLGLLGEGKVVTVLPANRELSTLEAANMLGVSRPFLIKQMETGAIAYRLVGSHRRITLDALKELRQRMQAGQSKALQRMADNAAELGLDY